MFVGLTFNTLNSYKSANACMCETQLIPLLNNGLKFNELQWYKGNAMQKTQHMGKCNRWQFLNNLKKKIMESCRYKITWRKFTICRWFVSRMIFVTSILEKQPWNWNFMCCLYKKTRDYIEVDSGCAF